MDATASILAKAQSDASKEDIALGIISMVSENYKKTFKAADIRECTTIGDLCKLILGFLYIL